MHPPNPFSHLRVRFLGPSENDVTDAPLLFNASHDRKMESHTAVATVKPATDGGTLKQMILGWKMRHAVDGVGPTFQFVFFTYTQAGIRYVGGFLVFS